MNYFKNLNRLLRDESLVKQLEELQVNFIKSEIASDDAEALKLSEHESMIQESRNRFDASAFIAFVVGVSNAILTNIRHLDPEQLPILSFGKIEIIGDVSFLKVKIPIAIIFEEVIFSDSLSFIKCEFESLLKFSGVHIKSLLMQESQFNYVDISGVNLAGLFFDRSK